MATKLEGGGGGGGGKAFVGGAIKKFEEKKCGFPYMDPGLNLKCCSDPDPSLKDWSEPGSK